VLYRHLNTSKRSEHAHNRHISRNGKKTLLDILEIFSTNSTIEITTASSVKDEVKVIDAIGKESNIFALIVFSWMQSVTSVHVAEVFLNRFGLSNYSHI
jgi:hypothetical protein